MKRYFQLKASWDPKVIGRSETCHTVGITSKDYLEYTDQIDQDLDKFFYGKQKSVYDNMPGNLTGVLHNKRKFTDFMSIVPYFKGLEAIVSERIKEVFECLCIPENEYILKPISLRGTDMPYYLLFIPIIEDTEFIYPETIFRRGSDQYKTFNTREEYFNFNEVGYYIQTVGLPQKYLSYEILNPDWSGAFYSERIIDAFEEAGIVGYQVIRGGYFFRKIVFV
ncbi:hypothetical protein [Duncaniella dubosii]|jgi:hypothetical protein|uniref:hypothetical protein n=1 Tax=Duncaniella dubosii TaxID=2518971 RepID=UPI0032B24654